VQQRDQIQILIWQLVCCVVDTPEGVNVEATYENELTRYRVNVQGREIGQVIGKQGRTARALRTLLAAIAVKQKRRFQLDIASDSLNPQQRNL
jgi:predicted RNA-binding protein YlqC (UPF0109 family)